MLKVETLVSFRRHLEFNNLPPFCHRLLKHQSCSNLVRHPPGWVLYHKPRKVRVQTPHPIQDFPKLSKIHTLVGPVILSFVATVGLASLLPSLAHTLVVIFCSHLAIGCVPKAYHNHKVISPTFHLYPSLARRLHLAPVRFSVAFSVVSLAAKEHKARPLDLSLGWGSRWCCLCNAAPQEETRLTKCPPPSKALTGMAKDLSMFAVTPGA